MSEQNRFANYTPSSTPINGSNLTEADSLIFAELAYIRPSEGSAVYNQVSNGSMNLQDYAKAMYDELTTNGTPKNSSDADKVAMLKTIAESDRYKNCTVSNYRSVNTVSDDPGTMEQWGAVTVELNDSQNTAVLAYRGTDGTKEGWDEDWLLGYENGTNAQQDSAQYLADYANGNPDANIILTGHSKGGNDAIYSYMNSDQGVRDQVSHVYNYDGPGVSYDTSEHPEYADAKAELNEKLDSYLPKDSVVGQALLDTGKRHYIDADGSDSAQSDVPIMSEHDAYTWHLNEDGTFEEVDQSALSQYLNNVLDDTLQNRQAPLH